MKYRFFGTAAAEGIPAVFCNCPVCAAARAGENGYTQKDVRTRSGSMINDDLLIDFSADSNMHAIENNLAFGKIKYMAITHAHCDHLYPQEFSNRDGVGHGRNLLREELDVVCSEQTKENLLSGLIRTGCRKTTVEKLQFQTPSPYESATVGPYIITALPAEHMGNKGGAYFYLITDTRENKTVLHCNDTALPLPETIDFLQNSGVKIDFAELDCTLFGVGFDHHCSHMGYVHCVYLKNELLRRGIATQNTIFYVNHFTHNDYLPYEEMVNRVKKDGFLVSYDGLAVEF